MTTVTCSRLSVAAIGLAVLCTPHQAEAGGLLYSTGFEPPNWTAGTPIAGQNGWVNAFGNGTGYVTTTNPASGSQSLTIPGTDLVATGGGINDGLYRPDLNVFHVDPSVTPIVYYQVDTRLDGALTPPPITGDLISANVVAQEGGHTLSELYVSSDGDIWANSGLNFYQFGRPATTGQYYSLGMLLDIAHRTANVYVDGELLGTMAMPSPDVSDNNIKLAVDMVAVTGFDSSGYSATFDNYLVSDSLPIAVPEPNSHALAVFGCLAVATLMAQKALSRDVKNIAEVRGGSLRRIVILELRNRLQLS